MNFARNRCREEGFFAERESGKEQESWLVRNCSKLPVEVKGNQNLELVTPKLFVYFDQKTVQGNVFSDRGR